MQLKPGIIGIKFRDDGQVTGFDGKSQKALYTSGVNQNWKIVKIDSEMFTKKLLIKKAGGSKPYTVEFAYTGDRPDVTK